jgi:hypothetical protein
MTDEPDNLVLEMLRRLDTKVELIGGDLNAVKTDMAELRRQGGAHTRTLDVLSQDVRMINSKIVRRPRSVRRVLGTNFATGL